MKTKLEYQSDITETNKLICERYWLREGDKRSGFIYTCKEIGQEFDVKHQDIPSIVKINSHLVVLEPSRVYRRQDCLSQAALSDSIRLS